MNKKAEEFKAYVEEMHPQTFTIEEIPDDTYETVVFRSFAEVRGNRLPLVVILDTSIYAMIRILVVPRAVRNQNREELLEMLNRYNKKYKTCKYYLDDEENIVLDTCILCGEEKIDGDLVYAMFRVLLQEPLREIGQAQIEPRTREQTHVAHHGGNPFQQVVSHKGTLYLFKPLGAPFVVRLPGGGGA